MTRPRKPQRNPVKQLIRAISYQRKTPLTMPLEQRLEMLRRGFRSSAYELYNFAENNPDDYLPDVVSRQTSNINGPLCRTILEDKLLFSTLFKDTFKVPAVLGLVERGQLYPAQQTVPFGDVAALLEYCRRHPGVMLKPSDGSQGRGISSVAVQEGRVLLNGQEVSRGEVEAALSRLDNYLVTERVVQDGYAHRIFPDAANSIRINTMQDPDADHCPFIAVAVHRFGSKTTAPTDNVSRGGLMAKIDLDTGVMSSAIKFPYETGGKRFWCSHHPDTGARIKGVVVPGWQTLKEQLLKSARAHRFLRYVGWDVIIAGSEFWMVEANHSPSPAVQLFHPYLKDPKVRRFFEHYGVV